MVIINGDVDKNLKFRVIEIGKNDTCESSWGPGMRDYYMIHFCISGEGVFNDQKVKKGDYFICEPYTKIHYYENKNNPWQYVWIIFEGEQVQEVLSSYGIQSKTCVSKFNSVEDLIALQKVIFTKEGLTPINNEVYVTTDKKINYWTNLIFSMKSEDEVKNLTRKPDIKSTHVKKAVEFINSSIHKKITPSLVAQFVKLDEKYLYSLFSNIEGCSLREYINRQRVEKAKTLLKFSNMNISEIAYSIGIEDPLYFSKLFKKYVGVPPKQYRIKLKQTT